MVLLALAGTILVWEFLMLQAACNPVPTISMSSIHANTLAGSDTRTDDVVWFPSLYTGDIGSTFVYQLWDFPNTNGPSIWLFSPTATASNRLMGILPSTDLLFTRNSLLHFRSKLYLTCTGGEDRLQVHTLTYDASTNTYGQVNWNYHPSIASAIKTIADNSPSSYVFYLDVSTATSSMRKWDTNLPTRDAAGAVVQPTDSECLQLSDNNIAVYGRDATTVYWIDRTNLSPIATFTGPVEPRGFGIDNQNPRVYFATVRVGSYGISRILLGTTTYTQTHAIPPVAGQSTYEYANAINLGNMAYIGLIRFHEANCPFRIYAKADLVEIPMSRYTPVYFPGYTEDNLLPSYVIEGKKSLVHFGLQVLVSGVYNFQSWRATFDLCQMRVALVCTACPPGYYIDSPGFIDNSCLLISTGPNPITGAIVACQDPNCSECGSDYTICTKCDQLSSSPWLYQSNCLQISAFANGIGADALTFTAIPCSDPMCLNCRADYNQCALCNSVLGYLADSNYVCKFDNSTALKVVSGIYDPRQAIASVTFDAPILVTGNRSFLNFVVVDSATSREYTCEQLNCVKQVQSRGVSVTFKTNLTIQSGIIIFDSDPTIKIARENDSRVFIDYPVLIPAASLFEASARFKIPTISIEDPVSAAQAVQLPATLFFAVMYPSLTPLFDDIFAKITVIAFYSSPPMTVLDNAILSFKNVTILPFEIPNLFKFILQVDNCYAGQMFDRYQYKCRFLENYGVDLTIILLMLVISLLAKGALYLAKRSLQKNKSTSVSDAEDEVPSSSGQLSGKELEQPKSGSPPKGEVAPQQTTHKTAETRKSKTNGLDEALSWFDRHFGFFLLLSRLEGKQAEYLVYAFQDFWSNDGSSSKTISTVAAVLMLTYPVFSMYVIQGLVAFLCQEYHIPRVFYGRQKILPISKLKTRVDQMVLESRTGLRKSTIGTRDLSRDLRSIEYQLIQADSHMNLDQNTALQQRYFYAWRFWFDECVVPKSDIWFSVPVITLLRNVILALLIVSNWLTPKSQCVAGLVVEVSFFLYIWNYSVKNRCLEIMAERVISICSVGFLLGKYFSHSVDQEFLQTSLALTLLTIILVMMLVTALVTILSVVVWAVKLYRQKKSKKRSQFSIDDLSFGQVASRPVPLNEKAPKPIIKVRIPSVISAAKVAKHWINQPRTQLNKLTKETESNNETVSPSAKTQSASKTPTGKTSAAEIRPLTELQLRSPISQQTRPAEGTNDVPVIVRLAKQRTTGNVQIELRRVSSRAK